ncbi:hypothetical protein A4A49_19232 [Nicotiana attenuata]|uniref:DUF4283 domain-containing protein n=1 Tax=Nicotiana attenuata TaxID=49451 RepID=A0A314KGU0_NICAT|nr:hypothetical protein A4A49_19232 [Nicotiana attenuata]
MKGMGSAPTILHGQVRKESTAPVEFQALMVKTPTNPVQNETVTAITTRKLTFSAGLGAPQPTLTDVVQGNRSLQSGLKLNYYPPIIKDGIKIVRLNYTEVEEQNRKWRTSLIGYVIGGSPLFKEMLKFVYGVWQFVSTPHVLLHDEGYFIFKFDSDEDRDLVLRNGPYTFKNRPMILKQWELDFQMSKEATEQYPNLGHRTGECSAQAEMIQKTDLAPKGQAETKKQQGEQHKRGRKQVTKWVVKPNAAKKTQGKEARAEPSTNKATTIAVTRQEEDSEGTIQNENAEFQLAKTKGKQVQSPKVRTSLRDGFSDANIEAMLHQNRFSALRIHEKEDASQASKKGRVPLAQPL